MKTIKADYLVVGAGAMDMAFVDTLITETDATVVLVDRNDQPGGHWINAYPYVRLHQPSAYYGVNSRRLGSDSIDAGGWNEGFYELAGGSEVCAYYDAVMRQHLLPTGRVSYFPMCEYLGNNHFRTLAGEDYRVEVRRRVVDATHLSVVAPSMRPPPYGVAAGVACIPPNGLPKATVHGRYVIVGGGKTSMDACVWLLRYGIPPERLTWIRPRDSWLLDRACFASTRRYGRRCTGVRSCRTASSNNCDRSTTSSGWATSSHSNQAESCPTTARLTPTRRRCTSTTPPRTTTAGRCHPTKPLDWITMTIEFNHNQLRWFDDPELMSWLNGARLNAASHMQAGDADAQDVLSQIAPRLRAANDKLEALLRV
jgi:hypothetical protein